MRLIWFMSKCKIIMLTCNMYYLRLYVYIYNYAYNSAYSMEISYMSRYYIAWIHKLFRCQHLIIRILLFSKLFPILKNRHTPIYNCNEKHIKVIKKSKKFFDYSQTLSLSRLRVKMHVIHKNCMLHRCTKLIYTAVPRTCGFPSLYP